MIHNYKDQSPSRCRFKDYPSLSAQDELVDDISVARVRPRTSKGITDLLLPQTSTMCDHGSPSKKSAVNAEAFT